MVGSFVLSLLTLGGQSLIAGDKPPKVESSDQLFQPSLTEEATASASASRPQTQHLNAAPKLGRRGDKKKHSYAASVITQESTSTLGSIARRGGQCLRGALGDPYNDLKPEEKKAVLREYLTLFQMETLPSCCSAIPEISLSPGEKVNLGGATIGFLQNLKKIIERSVEKGCFFAHALKKGGVYSEPIIQKGLSGLGCAVSRLFPYAPLTQGCVLECFISIGALAESGAVVTPDVYFLKKRGAEERLRKLDPETEGSSVALEQAIIKQCDLEIQWENLTEKRRRAFSEQKQEVVKELDPRIQELGEKITLQTNIIKKLEQLRPTRSDALESEVCSPQRKGYCEKDQEIDPYQDLADVLEHYGGFLYGRSESLCGRDMETYGEDPKRFLSGVNKVGKTLQKMLSVLRDSDPLINLEQDTDATPFIELIEMYNVFGHTLQTFLPHVKDVRFSSASQPVEGLNDIDIESFYSTCAFTILIKSKGTCVKLPVLLGFGMNIKPFCNRLKEEAQAL
jgi:hypothetical protein